MTPGKAKVLLAAIISVRASAFLFSKLLLQSMGPFTLMGIRFLLAFALLAVLFHRRFRNMSRHVFLGGTAMGVAFFATMSFELCALRVADSSTVSFLENTAVVFVPVAEALLLREALSRRTALSAVTALLGVGLLTLGSEGLHLGAGAALSLGAALCYTAAMLVTDRFSKQGDTLLMGILQVGWTGLLGGVAAFLLETPALPQAPAEWLFVTILAVVCTCFGFAFQPVAQKPLKAHEVSVMCALSPVVASLLGVTVLGEQLSATAIAGMCLVLASIVLRALRPSPAKPARA